MSCRLAFSFLMLCAWVVPAAALEFRDYQIGANLSAEEAESLEERLEADPGDITARTHLIIYYYRAFLDEEARRARHNHVLWLIRNAPQAGVLAEPYGEIELHFDVDGYVADREAWLSHIEREPTNVTFLSHAANFMSQHQDRDLIIEYLQELQRLDPDNPKWPTDLGHQYLRETYHEAADTTRAIQALELFQRAHELSRHEPGRLFLLVHLGKAALAAGSPALGSFGPNMRLALELLQRDEREVVLEYFELCSKFWPRDELNEWAALVKVGGIPDFGANLVY